jgi:hypothetical protein
MIRSALVFAGAACLLFAADDGKPKEASHTERLEFPAHGVLHVKNSFGELDIQGWDEPRVEVTTVKSGPERKTEQVKVTLERHGDDVTVATSHPHRLWPPAPPLSGAHDIDLWYHIKVPRNASVTVEHGVGDVYVANLTGDIRAAVRSGEIGLRLPPQEQYTIDAKTDLGAIYSDYPGKERGRVWPLARRFVETTTSDAHKLTLRIGYGDIVIYKMIPSAAPAAATLR